MAPAMFFLSCQPPLCPQLPAEIATPARALHGYCNVLSPDDPKTHPSRCQHYGPWSPQGIDTRPASKDPDSKGYHSAQWLRFFLKTAVWASWASAFFPQAQPRVPLSRVTLIPTEAPLKIYLGKWTFESWLIRCAWQYSNFAGVKNLRSNKESHCVSLKILRQRQPS